MRGIVSIARLGGYVNGSLFSLAKAQRTQRKRFKIIYSLASYLQF